MDVLTVNGRAWSGSLAEAPCRNGSETLAILFLVTGAFSALLIIIYLLSGHRQSMWIMDGPLSLSAWRVGMYGWMAVATFAIFGREDVRPSPVRAPYRSDPVRLILHPT